MIVSQGNKKIHKDTLIINITTAKNCPSYKLGLCQIPSNCYAKRPERLYPATLPFRERQAVEWDSKTYKELAKELKYEIDRHYKPKIEYIRFSECGDFKNQQDVKKLKKIALEIPEVIFYGYTARRDLLFDNRPDNLIINGSGFMLDNSFTVIPKADRDKYPIVCSGSCRYCQLCKVKNYEDIKIPIH